MTCTLLLGCRKPAVIGANKLAQAPVSVCLRDCGRTASLVWRYTIAGTQRLFLSMLSFTRTAEHHPDKYRYDSMVPAYDCVC